MVTDINSLDLNKSYTYADYLTWQFGEMVEIIKGKIYKMSPAPSNRHQVVSGNLHGELYRFLKGNKCKLYAAPFDVRLTYSKNNDSVSTVVQPDLCVICDAHKLDENGCNGAPDFIIEILSPSTAHKDTHEKYAIYEEAGVNEYWIVDPFNHVVDIFLLENQKYIFCGKYTKGDIVKVVSIPDLQIDLNDIFTDN